MNLFSKSKTFLEKLIPALNTKSEANEAFDELQKRLQYTFKNKALLIQSLTHKSKVQPNDKKGLLSNERMEFLGDAVLDCLVTEHIYHRYPDFAEGQLSKIKSLIVSRKIIGEVAVSVELGRYLIMGESERKTGGARRMSILSNAFEAILGAVYLDGGLDETRPILNRLLFPKIENFINDKQNINYKSKILELAQAEGFGIPTYPLLATEGPDHAKRFIVGVDIAGIRLGQGEGPNKKIAQQNAAYNALRVYDRESIVSRLKEDT